jgi:hypothetical protein
MWLFWLRVYRHGIEDPHQRQGKYLTLFKKIIKLEIKIQFSHTKSALYGMRYHNIKHLCSKIGLSYVHRRCLEVYATRI